MYGDICVNQIRSSGFLSLWLRRPNPGSGQLFSISHTLIIIGLIHPKKTIIRLFIMVLGPYLVNKDKFTSSPIKRSVHQKKKTHQKVHEPTSISFYLFYRIIGLPNNIPAFVLDHLMLYTTVR